MTRMGITTPMATLAPVDSPDDGDDVDDGEAAALALALALAAEAFDADADAAETEEAEAEALASAAIVGSAAFAATDHPDPMVGQLGALSKGEYADLGVPVGLDIDHCLLRLS